MAKKKKIRHGHPRAPSVDEVLRRAEEALRQGQPAQAVRLLARAEQDTREAGAVTRGYPRSGSTRGTAVAALLARAFAARARGAETTAARRADLEEAARRAPEDAAVLLALGASRLAAGEAGPAFEALAAARARSPGEPVAERGYFLGLLAAGRTAEAGRAPFRAALAAQPDPTTPPLHHSTTPFPARLTLLQEMLSGSPAPVVSAGEAAGSVDVRTYGRVDEGPRAEPSSARPHFRTSIRPYVHTSARPYVLTSTLPHVHRALVEGLWQLVSGDRGQAIAILAELPALDRNPSHAEAAVLSTQLYYSGRARAGVGDLAGARRDLFEAHGLARAHALSLPWLRRLGAEYHHLAAAALEAGDFAGAAECWQRVLELQPGDGVAAANLASARQARAALAWRSGEWQQAVDHWMEALRESPHDEELLRRVAVGYEKLERQEAAIPHWRTLAQRWRQQARGAPPDSLQRQQIARLEEHLVEAMMKAGRPPYEIRNELDAALKINPEDDDLRRRFANFLLEIGEPRPALRQIDQLERRQGVSADLLVLKGSALELQERENAALDCFERAVALEPSHLGARRGLLTLLSFRTRTALAQGGLERVFALCERMLALEPEDPDALRYLVFAQFLHGRAAEAKRTIARLLATDPDDPVLRVSVGHLYLVFRRNRDAETEFKQAIRLDPGALCLFAIGHAYLKAELLNKALAYFDRAAAAALDPDLVLQIANLLWWEEELDHAERYARRGLAMAPGDPRGHLALGAVLLHQSRLAEAERHLLEAEHKAVGRPEFASQLHDIRMLKADLRDEREMEEETDELDDLFPGEPLPADLRRQLARIARSGRR